MTGIYSISRAESSSFRILAATHSGPGDIRGCEHPLKLSISPFRRPSAVRIGTRRLDGDRERLVTKIIDQEYLSQTRPTVEEIVRIVHQRCIEAKFKPV
jgi:hypothetical protein